MERRNYNSILAFICSSLMLLFFLAVFCPINVNADEENPTWDAESDKVYYLSLPSTDGSHSDCTLVQSNGKFGMIDASNPSEYGPYAAQGGNGKTVAEFMRKLGVKHIDFAVATHAHSDHIGGFIDLVDEKNSDGNPFFDSDTVYIHKKYLNWDPKYEDPTWQTAEYFKEVTRKLTEAKVTMVDITSDDTSGLSKIGATMTKKGDYSDNISFKFGNLDIALYNLDSIVNKEGYTENDNSIITQITKGLHNAVVLGDASAMIDYKYGEVIYKKSGTIDTLRTGHHGISSANGKQLLEFLEPKNFVLSSNGPLRQLSYKLYADKYNTPAYKAIENVGAIVEDFDKSSADLQTFADESCRALVKAKTYHPVIRGWQIWGDATAPDGWTYAYIKDDGKYATGWQYIEGAWYCFDSEGYNLMLQDTVYYDKAAKKKYVLTRSGIMGTGWVKAKDKWYFADSSGALKTGWVTYGKDWCFMDNDGAMQTGWVEDGGHRYFLDASGLMKIGWVQDNNKWYLLNSSGAMQKGWQYTGGAWYYLGNDGVMQTGWIQEGGNSYYLSSSGAMKTGWLQDNGKWYLLNSSGAMLRGWQYTGGAWYYLGNDGVMQTGWVQEGGNSYYLTSSGAMKTGWLQDNGKWFYLNSSGAMLKGWVKHYGIWYYLGQDGVMYTGTHVIDNTTYNFDTTGALA